MQRISLILLLLICVATLARAEETKPRRSLEERFPIKTSGGIWFWGDVLFFQDFHIQRNVKTDSYRLLDGKAKLRATGTYEECLRRLREIQAEEGLLPMAGSVLIIMHGFGSNAIGTKRLADWFREQNAYDHVINMAYPSTMQPILEHAKMLDSVVKNLPPTVRHIDLLGHSLGSISMRRYLSGPLDHDWRLPESPTENAMEFRSKFVPDLRIKRLVMLGPPNNGAEIARRLIGRDPIRRHFSGESGDELGIDWEKTKTTLGIPCCEFAIIAGGRGDNKGFTPLIAGDDDGIVSTEGTKLPGAAVWIQYYAGHGELLLAEEVYRLAFRFFQTGNMTESPLSQIP